MMLAFVILRVTVSKDTAVSDTLIFAPNCAAISALMLPSPAFSAFTSPRTKPKLYFTNIPFVKPYACESGL